MGATDFLGFLRRAVSPLRELGSYEALWLSERASFTRLAAMFAERPGSMPSDFIDPDIADRTALEVLQALKAAGIDEFGVQIYGAGDYPEPLRDARSPLAMLYCRGWWDLVNSPRSVAVVGTRKVTPEGVLRTRRLVRLLVENDFTIVSGLARGVDTEAHTTAIAAGGRTIAVVGTPLTRCYPTENRELQEEIARKFLLVSQVPILRYAKQGSQGNRLFFPERNKTMSALTQATIIVEASDTSGTLVQARAAIEQGRKLFILDSCFSNPAITWPAKFEQRGAVRVRTFEDILEGLKRVDHEASASILSDR